MTGRGIAWCLARHAMGLGQGIALRSGRLLLYGLFGRPHRRLARRLALRPHRLLLLGPTSSALLLWSRTIGLGVIGGTGSA